MDVCSKWGRGVAGDVDGKSMASLFRRNLTITTLALAAIPVLAPAAAHAAKTPAAKPRVVHIETTSKKRAVVNRALKVIAVTRRDPTKVSFYVDGKRRYITRHAPYRLYGRNGGLRPSTLKNGVHRITVRALFKGGRTESAKIRFTVNNRVVTTPNPTPNETPIQTTTTVVRTSLPPRTSTTGGSAPGTSPQVAPAASSSASASASATPPPPALWSGAADLGFGTWQIQDGPHNPTVGDTRVSLVDAPAAYGMPGHKAFSFQVNTAKDPGGSRAELSDVPAEHQIHEGDDFWYGDVLYVPSNPNQSLGWEDSNHALFQFRQQGTGSPPLLLTLNATNGRNALYIQDSKDYHPVVSGVQNVYDRAIPIEIHVHFASDPSKGSYEVWADGKQVYAATGVATLVAGQTSYFKEGQYGDGRGNLTYWLGAKRGTSRASVLR